MVKTYKSLSGQNVRSSSVVLFDPIVSIDISNFVSNNTHFTNRDVISKDEVRLAIHSTLSKSGVPIDELIPRFVVTRENEISNLDEATAIKLFPQKNPFGLLYRNEANRLVFYFGKNKALMNIAIQFLPGNAPGNKAALESVANVVQVVTEVASDAR